MDAVQSNPRLPVIRTLLDAWGTVPRNMGLAARLYWPWLAILAVSAAAWGVGILVNSGLTIPSFTLVGGAGWVPILVMILALVIAAPAIFVGWHRGIERGERPSASIQVDGAVWGYAGYSLLIALAIGLAIGFLVFMVMVVAAISTGLGDNPMSIERFAALRHFLPLAIIPYYLLLSRFSLVLPAVAVGRPMSLAESFRRTRGNTWRLTMGAGLIYLPAVVFSGIAEIVGVAFPGAVALIATLSLISLAITLFCLHASLSFGTLALRRLAPVEQAA